jgi:hypothetical protein
MTTFNYPPTSRYYAIPTATLTGLDGESVITYLQRRMLPPAERFALFKERVVDEGDRLDHIAAEELGDTDAFWRIADANSAMRPQDLTAQPGRRLRITLPEGVPGVPDA